MAGEFLLVGQFAAAGLMLALAAWLLWLRFGSPINRAFALLLAVRGLGMLAGRLFDLSGGDPYWEGVGGYLQLGIVPALAYFMLAYAGPRRLRDSPPARWGLLGLLAMVLIAYAWDHCLYRCAAADGLRVIGPLGMLAYPIPLAEAAAGLLLAVHARSRGGVRGVGASLLAVAFLLNASLDASIVLGRIGAVGFDGALAPFAPSAWATLAFVLPPLAFAPILAALVVLRRAASTPSTRRFTARIAGLAPLAALTGLLVGASPPFAGSTYVALSIAAVWRILIPALATYGILRHQLFDLEVKVHATIKKSTVAAAFVGVFFVVSEAAAQFLSTEGGLGPYLGIAATGLLLVFLAPLHTMGERLATATLPQVRHPDVLTPEERGAAFRSAVELAMRDGILTTKEERALAELADRLRLTPGEALRLREEAVRGGTGAGAGGIKAHAGDGEADGEARIA